MPWKLLAALWKPAGAKAMAGQAGARRARSRRLVVEPLEGRALLTAMADLTAFRPQTAFINFAQFPVAEAVEEDVAQGPGIRINGDDDNANSRADFLDASTAAAGDNDLVRVDVAGAGDQLTVSFTGSLAVWTSVTKAAAVASGAAVSAGQTLWVEYVSLTHSIGGGASLTLQATDSASGTSASDRVVFHSFQSVVLAIGGNTQNPANFGDPRLGVFTLGGQLYARGYDVHLFAHSAVNASGTTAGQGAAYNEVVSAVLKRSVDNVALVGYSWGGGAVYNLASALGKNSAVVAAGYQLKYTAAIDAVRQGSILSESRLPPRSALHHVFYQRRDFPRGAAVTGATNINVTNTTWGRTLGHTTIDDSSELQRQIVTLLTSRVIIA